MRLACREYITLKASAVPVENFRTGRAIIDDLRRVAADRKIGSIAVPLYSSEDIEQEALEESEILAASGGRLPVIYVSVTFLPGELSGAELADWEARFGLVLFNEFVEPF